MTSTASRALAIVELLEAILVSLGDGSTKGPAFQLFLLQRVSKFWKSTIENSVAIQRLMCLRREQDAASLEWPRSIRWLDGLDSVPVLRDPKTATFGCYLPFNAVNIKFSALASGSNFWSWGLKPWTEDKLSPAFKLPEASWRRMIFPMYRDGKEVPICLPMRTEGWPMEVLFWLRSNNGEVSLGGLLEQIHKITNLTGKEIATFARESFAAAKEEVFDRSPRLAERWRWHDNGQCLDRIDLAACPICAMMRTSVAVGVDWSLDGSRLEGPSIMARRLLAYDESE